MKVYLHFLTWLFIVFPLDLLGLLLLPCVTKKYSLGSFPYLMRWFDDKRGTLLEGIGREEFIASFGLDHWNKFMTANDTWVGRYVWAALRNPTNYFQHEVLGKDQYDPSAWLIARDGFLRIRIGYKIEDDPAHQRRLALLDIPAQWVFSIGIRLGE